MTRVERNDMRSGVAKTDVSSSIASAAVRTRLTPDCVDINLPSLFQVINKRHASYPYPGSLGGKKKSVMKRKGTRVCSFLSTVLLKTLKTEVCRTDEA